MATKILIVDDHESLRILLRDNLELEGFEVAVAAGGVEALELAAAFVPDIAIVDIGLPDIPGWEVCGALRGAEATRRAELVLLTAESRPKVAEKMKGLGIEAYTYVAKPYDPIAMGDLLRRVAAKT